MISDCQLKKIDLILICKLDRFFRSVSDYYEVMGQIGDIPWKAIHEDYETETASGIFKVNIMLSVAQSEADRTSERIRTVFKYKKEKGEVCSGKVALGYKIEDKRWVKNKEEEALVNEFFNTYLSTLSIRKTQERMIELGHNMALNTIQYMLSSPAYYAEPSYVTEPYITLEQHETILKAHKSNIRRHKFNYIYSGLCYCKICGSRMAGKKSTFKNKHGESVDYVSYICKKHAEYPQLCSGSTIKESVIEEIILDKVEEQLKDYNIKVSTSFNNPSKDKADKVKSKLKRIMDLYELGDLTLEEYKKKREALNIELSTLENNSTQKIKSLPKNWRSIYNSLDRIHKNAFWVNLISRIEVSGSQAQSIDIIF